MKIAKIANFMIQHELSQEQISAGLYNPDLTSEEKDKLKKLMIVNPNDESIYIQAVELYNFIREILRRENCEDFHIMGQANLMICLYMINSAYGYGMFESTTERISQEIKNPDGSTLKTNVFKFVRLRKYGY